jgi:thioesterase-3
VPLEITVRSTDVDLFGHVNNAVYLNYLEWARVELLTEVGLPIETCLARGVVPVVVEIRIRYRRELCFGERVTVTAEPVELRRSVGVLRQEVRKADGTVAAEAEVTFLFIDAKTRRSVPMPPEMTAWLNGGGATAP